MHSLLIILAGVNMMGGFIFGYNTGVIAGVNTLFLNEPKGNKWHVDQWHQGILSASILVGAMFGSIIIGPIQDKYGRKPAVIILSLICIVGAPLLSISPDLDALIGFRTFLGLSVGMTGIVCPRYVSETAPKDKRGPLGIFFQLAITIGIFVAYVANWALTDKWRVMFGLGAIPGVLLLLLGFVMPESPEWQSTKRGYGEGSSLLTMNSESALPLGERLGIFVRSRALYIGIVLAVAQQLTGINAFMYYAPGIFKSAHIANANYPTMGLGAWNAITTVLAIPLVDRLGRRPLLIVGTIIMTIACLFLGLTYRFQSHLPVGPLSIVLLFIFVAAFEVGDGPLFWMVAHELFTPEIKTVGSSTLNAAQWLFNIALTLGFPTIQDQIQEGVFYIFSGIGAVCVVIMILALPETRGTHDKD